MAGVEALFCAWEWCLGSYSPVGDTERHNPDNCKDSEAPQATPETVVLLTGQFSTTKDGVMGLLLPGSLVSSQVMKPFCVWQAMKRCPCPGGATCKSPQNRHLAAPRATCFHRHLQRPSEERGMGGNVFVPPFPCLEEMRQKKKFVFLLNDNIPQ